VEESMPIALPFGKHFANSAVILPSPQPMSSKASFPLSLILEISSFAH
jgi:hypothetical protein